jgi:hypothetical protein
VSIRGQAIPSYSGRGSANGRAAHLALPLGALAR